MIETALPWTGEKRKPDAHRMPLQAATKDAMHIYHSLDFGSVFPLTLNVCSYRQHVGSIAWSNKRGVNSWNVCLANHLEFVVKPQSEPESVGVMTRKAQVEHISPLFPAIADAPSRLERRFGLVEAIGHAACSVRVTAQRRPRALPAAPVARHGIGVPSRRRVAVLAITHPPKGGSGEPSAISGSCRA